ncbi:hypothetical protein BC829DRAFT_48102 [Chytridium lagenaria]|nr:hypothetical protein BC829DRAFT_48102 [Chytridium lagenaria]
MCILGALTIIVIFGQSPLWISRITDAIKAQAINGFVSTSATQANAVNAAFASYLISTVVATSYVRDVLQNPGSTPDTVIPVNRTYPSYFAAPLSGGDPPLPPAFAIPRYSSYYKGSITELSQWSAIASNDTTSTFDNPFRAITLDNAGAQAIQAGFEDDGWRIYPLSYDVTRFNPRTQTSCQRPDSPPQFAAFNGYNPRCRPWYYTAVQAAARNQSESIRRGLGPAVLSAPYVSQASSGRALITASQAFYNSTGVVGVIGLQVQIDNLNDQLTNTTILKNGYIFVVDVSFFSSCFFPISFTISFLNLIFALG